MLRQLLLLSLLCVGFFPLSAQIDPRIPEGVEKRLDDNKVWLKANAKREEVREYESGLQVEILEEGYGKHPNLKDFVYVYYKGSLIDGTVFQESDQNKDPIRFRVRNTVPGFSEGLQYLRVGSKARLYIPSDLGYGAKGTSTIPPYSVLIFEVVLVDAE